MGVFLVTCGLGNYVSMLLVLIVRSAISKQWYPSENPNDGKMEYFFFLLAGLMMVNFVVFLFIASSYKYKTAPRRERTKDLDTEQPPDHVGSISSHAGENEHGQRAAEIIERTGHNV